MTLEPHVDEVAGTGGLSVGPGRGGHGQAAQSRPARRMPVQALSDGAVKTANGNMRIGEVRRGSVSLQTAAGSIEVGVRQGTAAHFDAHSLVGSVHNTLTDTDVPGSADSTVKVHARTNFGAIEMRRALLDEYRQFN